MSIAPSTLQAIQFDGTPYSMPTKICTPIDAQMGPRVVRVDIPWTDAPYNASFNKRNVIVSVNLEQQSVAQPLDAIRFCKIDNTYNDVAVYVKFPDSGDTVVCPPNSVVGIPVYTNGQSALIFGTGFFAGRTLRTTVYFSNAPEPAFYTQDAPKFVITGDLTDTEVSGGAAVSEVVFAGPAFTDRLMVVVLGAMISPAAAINMTAASINGVACPIFQAAQTVFGVHEAIIAAFVPTGTTITVAVTYSVATTWVVMGIYSLSGATSAVPLSTNSNDSGYAPAVMQPFNSCAVDTIPGAFTVWGQIEDLVATLVPPDPDEIVVDAWRAKTSAPTCSWRFFHQTGESAGPISCAWNGRLMVGATFR